MALDIAGVPGMVFLWGRPAWDVVGAWMDEMDEMDEMDGMDGGGQLDVGRRGRAWSRGRWVRRRVGDWARCRVAPTSPHFSPLFSLR